ncbi:hypothetical protein FG386_000127 [Cryptosporidium ryanae]|uniref:uncharacterized protein n=1 Tax=Cryptosporidium ryanae TaxID=515981 RepID=UPI003519F0AA|nr:hypothetical protein FG386_000127 [Cryptosporidium ryanae]
MTLSEKGYIGLNERLLSEYEREEILDVSRETIVESQYVYFNSTNKGELLVYNRLSNTLLRVDDYSMVEYRLPELYKQEFSSRPLCMLFYTRDEPSMENEKRDNTEGCFSYVLDDIDRSRKVLVYRKIRIVASGVFGEISGDKCEYSWKESEYSECLVSLNDEELRGIVWWNFELNVLNLNNPGPSLGAGSDRATHNEVKSEPSLLLVTSEKLRLYALKENNISLIWEFSAKNLRMWYSIEFQCVLLQVSQNKLLPYVNIGLGEDQKPVKLQALELSISKTLSQEDILLINIYNNLYCMHIDCTNSRISLRDLLNHENCDLVLDINDSFKEFSVAKLDNLLVVLNLHGNKEFSIYDIKLLLDKRSLSEEEESGNGDGSGDGDVSGGESNCIGDSLNDGYYIVPSLFADRFKKNTVICMYGYSDTDYYRRLVYDNREVLESSTVLLLNSSANLVMRIFLNKIQYSKLILLERELIGSLVSTGTRRDEKLQLLPFVVNRSFSSDEGNKWDSEFTNRVKELYELEKERNDSLRQKNIMSLVMYVLELVKLKLDLKQKTKRVVHLLLLDMLLYLKNEPLLHTLLQYHVIQDSNKVLIELFNLYLHNVDLEDEKKKVRFELELNGSVDDRCCRCFNKTSFRENYFLLKNKLWLEQMCLDVAYRLGNVSVVVRVLMIRKEYRRIIGFLRLHSQQKILFDLNDGFEVLEEAILRASGNSDASKFPIHAILYKIGTDIDELECDPNVLIDLIKETKSWLNDYNDQIELIRGKINYFKENKAKIGCEKVNVFIIGKPNLLKCSVWLPELIHSDSNERDKEDCHVEKAASVVQGTCYFCSENGDGVSDEDNQHRSPNDEKPQTTENKDSRVCDNYLQGGCLDSVSDRNNSNFHSTFESVYVSAVESNETLTNNSTNEDYVPENRDVKVNSDYNRDGVNRTVLPSSGKSPILHLQSKLFVQNEYDELDSPFSSYASSSSSQSSFNSYE